MKLSTWKPLLSRACCAASRIAAAVALAATASTAVMAADEGVSTGAIVGIVTNSDKLPVAQAIVTAKRSDGGGFRAALTGSDGSFSLSDLPVGTWTITSHVEGAPDVSPEKLTVGASKVTRHDIVMQVQVAPPTPSPALTAAINAVVPLALQAPEPAPTPDLQTPFAFGDFSWLNGSSRSGPAFDTKFFTPEFRMDSYVVFSGNRPVDHTIVGSTEEFRSGEMQIEQISFGGDIHWDNVHARLLTMNGLFATTTPRNDASSGAIAGVGQWNLQDAYRYVSEANAGYHFDVDHGLNIDAGIFVSYIGLFSYYNFDNWTYQPSYVSSNTPWFFNGLRVQWFPTNTLKIEPWLINGWQSYARYNGPPGFGGQVLWMPTENFKLVLNNYTIGADNLYNNPPASNYGGFDYSKTRRFHTDDSIEYKYYQSNKNGAGISKAAFSWTVDAGCQVGGGVKCTGAGANSSNFLGTMFYNRLWFHNDLWAATLGGGWMQNPSLYLTLLPPINGATASTGTPYFPEAPGATNVVPTQWDTTLNFQYMPKPWITWWTELGYRHSDIPYFAGRGGVTPPGGNNGSPASYACTSGAAAGTSTLKAAQAFCGPGNVWFPDLWTHQFTYGGGVLVKF